MTAAAAVDLYLSMASWYPKLLPAMGTSKDLVCSVFFQTTPGSPGPFPDAKTVMQICLIFPEPFARVPGKHPDIDQDQADDFQPEKDLAPYQQMQDYKHQDQNTQGPIQLIRSIPPHHKTAESVFQTPQNFLLIVKTAVCSWVSSLISSILPS